MVLIDDIWWDVDFGYAVEPFGLLQCLHQHHTSITYTDITAYLKYIVKTIERHYKVFKFERHSDLETATLRRRSKIIIVSKHEQSSLIKIKAHLLVNLCKTIPHINRIYLHARM